MSYSLKSLIDNPAELNRFLAADPGMRSNLLEMGFIKRVPFIRDHNDQFETQYVFTDAGIREMKQRIVDIIVLTEGSVEALLAANDR